MQLGHWSLGFLDSSGSSGSNEAIMLGGAKSTECIDDDDEGMVYIINALLAEDRFEGPYAGIAGVKLLIRISQPNQNKCKLDIRHE